MNVPAKLRKAVEVPSHAEWLSLPRSTSSAEGLKPLSGIQTLGWRNLRSARASASLLPYYRAFVLGDHMWSVGRAAFGFFKNANFGPIGSGWTKYGQCPTASPTNLRTLQIKSLGSTHDATVANLCNVCLGGQGIGTWTRPATQHPSTPANELVYAMVTTGTVAAPIYGTYARYFWRPHAQRLNTYLMSPLRAARLIAAAEFVPPLSMPLVGPTLPPTLPPNPLNPMIPGPSLVMGPATRFFTSKGRKRRYRYVKAPPKGEKHKKFAVGLKGGTTTGRIIGAVGETGDFVESLYNALPRFLKKKEYNTLQERIAAVLNNADRIDWERAIGNLFVNQIEDAAFGMAGQAVAQQSGRWGRPAGFLLGSSSWRPEASDIYGGKLTLPDQ